MGRFVFLLLVFLGVPVWGQITLVNIGTAANDGTGDALRTSFGKINTNFLNLQTALGTVSNSVVAGVVPPTRAINTTAPLTGGGDFSADRTIALPASSATANGYLGSNDWSAFNAKTPATRSISTTSPLQGGGDLSANRTLSMLQASTAQAGYVSSADYKVMKNPQSGSPPTETSFVSPASYMDPVWVFNTNYPSADSGWLWHSADNKFYDFVAYRSGSDITQISKATDGSVSNTVSRWAQRTPYGFFDQWWFGAQVNSNRFSYWSDSQQYFTPNYAAFGSGDTEGDFPIAIWGNFAVSSAVLAFGTSSDPWKKVWIWSNGALSSYYDRHGTGSPEGAVASPKGAVYHRKDGDTGTSVYVKTSNNEGNTGWSSLVGYAAAAGPRTGTKTLTEGSATSFATINIANGKFATFVLLCTAYAEDGTQIQTAVNHLAFTIAKRSDGAGPYSGVATEGNTTAVSTGTLSTSIALAGATLQCNATSSLTQTSLVLYWTVQDIQTNDSAFSVTGL